jgi:hypothetical protein
MEDKYSLEGIRLGGSATKGNMKIKWSTPQGKD